MLDALYKTLADLGFKEALHPPITHMPIGLVVGALVFFLVALLFKRKSLVLSARHASILALVFAFPTILFGVFDWIHFYHGILMPAIKIKMGLAGAVLLLLGLGIALGKGARMRNLWMTLVYALSFVSVIGLGYFGAGIIYGRDLSPPPASSSTAVPGEGKAADGRELFAANCQACHAGGGNAIDPSLPLKTSKKLSSKAAFADFLRNPRLADGRAGQMPDFGPTVLDEAQVQDLLAYLRQAWD